MEIEMDNNKSCWNCGRECPGVAVMSGGTVEENSECGDTIMDALDAIGGCKAWMPED